jgi:hypothetical protein
LTAFPEAQSACAELPGFRLPDALDLQGLDPHPSHLQGMNVWLASATSGAQLTEAAATSGKTLHYARRQFVLCVKE